MFDSIGDLCVKRGLVTRSVAKPFALLIGSNAYNLPVSYNRYALMIALLRRGIQLISGHADGEEWANKHREHIWERILDKARPCYVISSQPDVGLCRAGKMKGIPVYDLQHGVIADEHLWYGEKYRLNALSKDLPDGFLCWDEQSAMALSKWAPQKGIDVRIIGNPWFLRFLLRNPKDSLVQEATNAGKIFNNGKPVILVSLQQWLTFTYKGVMVDALEKIILETANTYNWLLRLHPIQLRGPEKDMVQKYLVKTFGHLASVEWLVCSELALPIVLQQADLHLTDYSTVVIEASWMGLYSGLLSSHICPGGKYENLYLHERNLGLAMVLKQDSIDIERWIKQTLAKGKGKSTLKIAGQALHTFIDEIAVAAKTNHRSF